MIDAPDADLRERVLHALRTTPVPDAPADLPFPSHHQPGEAGWLSWCALCMRDADTLANAVLTALNPVARPGTRRAAAAAELRAR